MVGNNMKITKTYLKQIIKEELNNLLEAEETEEFKPNSTKFKEILNSLRRGTGWKIDPAVSGVSSDGQTITFSTYSPYSYSIKANIDNPSDGLVITDKITGEEFGDISKTPLKKLLGELDSDKLKVIAWIQNSLYRNKNKEFLRQLGWLP
jgi:hypothetical protein